MTQLRSHYTAIRAAGGEVLLISFFPPDRTRNWARANGLPYKLGADITREVYRKYGLGDAQLGDLVNLRAVTATAAGLLRGRRFSPNANWQQRGGYFVVGPRDTIIYSHPNKGSADHPPQAELLAALGVPTD